MEFLRENADAFLRNAKDLFEKGEFKLSAFNTEQAVQLYLKHLLAEKVGDFPRTHSLKRLFREAGSLCPKLFKMLEENSALIGDLESAYIGSRYYPMEYLESEVRQMIELADEIKEVTRECLHRGSEENC